MDLRIIFAPEDLTEQLDGVHAELERRRGQCEAPACPSCAIVAIIMTMSITVMKIVIVTVTVAVIMIALVIIVIVIRASRACRRPPKRAGSQKGGSGETTTFK